jgi:hypothetical protein
MQLFAVLAFMLVLPVASTLVDVSTHDTGLASAALKWFVFWAVGARLFTAGLKQVVDPAFTARQIFEIEDPAASKLALEIGFGNLSIGAIALASLWFGDWAAPAALAGAIFFGLAGIQHVRNRPTNGRERLVMWSDLFIALVLIACLLGTAAGA